MLLYLVTLCRGKGLHSVVSDIGYGLPYVISNLRYNN